MKATPDAAPRRLRETGMDLDDSALVQGYDLAGIQAAVESRTGGGGGGGISGPAIGLVAAAVIAVGLGLWGWSFGPAAEPPTDAVVAVAEAAPAVAFEAAPVTRTAQLPPATAPAVAPRSAPPTGPPSAALDIDEPAADGPPEAAPGPGPDAGSAEEGTATGDLAEQNAVFAAGESALAAADYTAAGAAFTDYLNRWPEGVFRDDALVATLDLAIRAGAWSSVEELAGSLAGLPSLAHRRARLEAARAEALVHLGRCPEALILAEQLERTDAQAVRRSCRSGSSR